MLRAKVMMSLQHSHRMLGGRVSQIGGGVPGKRASEMDSGRPGVLTASALPKLLGKERHHRMQQPQRGFKHGQDIGPVVIAAGVLRKLELLQLDVPIAEFAPEELPDGLCGFVIAVGCDGAVDLFGTGVEAAEDPAVFEGIALDFVDAPDLRRVHGSTRGPLHIHEQEAGGIPDLVGEVARAFQALGTEDDVGAGSRSDEQRHADGVGAVLLGDHQRIDHVALGLGHLLALGVAHQAVDVDRPERDVVHELQPQHDHAGDPEEQDVEAGDQQGGRVEGSAGPRSVRASLAWRRARGRN